MILPDFRIREWAENGGITPYEPHNINPASIDLRLGNFIRVPRWYWRNPVTRFLAWHILDKPNPRIKTHLYWSQPRRFMTYTLWPGNFVLCHSSETTEIPQNVAAILFSKSSTGRIGVEHLHAGYGDPGFGLEKKSQWTWELINAAPWPIELVAGRRLMQLALVRMEATPERDYRKTGRYQGQQGPNGS